MSKSIRIPTLLLILLLSASTLHAQEDVCAAKGGLWDGAAQRCTLTSSIQMTVNYPTGISAIPFVESTLDTFITDSQMQFAQQFSPALLEAPQINQWSLQIDYEQFQAAPHLLSLLLKSSTYSGGAHPNLDFRTFTFDLTAQQELSLNDLFLTGTQPWPIISQIVQAALRTQLGDMTDADWLATGTGENPDNYRNFALTDQGLTFFFPPYQVAAYAAGPQQVTIPYDQLAGLFNTALLTPPPAS